MKEKCGLRSIFFCMDTFKSKKRKKSMKNGILVDEKFT